MTRVDEVDWMAARDKEIDQRGVARPGGVMERRISVTGFCLGDRKAEVQHKADRFIIRVRFPAVAGQKFQVDARKTGDDAGVLALNGFCFLAPG